MRTFPVMVYGALVLSSIVLGACKQISSDASSVSAIDQANLCEVSVWRHDDVAKKCKPGQKVVFLPDTFGHEQLPIMFAAVNCDLRYSVALTTGAVTCIYNPITPTPAPAPQPAQSHMQPGAAPAK